MVTSLSPQPKNQLRWLDNGHGASAAYGVPIYSLAFACTRGTYPQRMARLSWPEWQSRQFTRLQYKSITRSDTA